jgi:hypothetical protein
VSFAKIGQNNFRRVSGSAIDDARPGMRGTRFVNVRHQPEIVPSEDWFNRVCDYQLQIAQAQSKCAPGVKMKKSHRLRTSRMNFFRRTSNTSLL